MKLHPSSMFLLAGTLALFNLPASAQEPPAPPPPGSEDRPRPETPAMPEKPRGPRQGEEKLTAYLGVLTGPVSRELRAQFGLAEGFGLQVAEVMPDSPAQAAGLKEHDVLVMFEDQKLVNMEQLQALVRAQKKNDQVTLKVITGGQTQSVRVTIGERLTMVNAEPSRGFMNAFPPGMRFYDHRGGGWEEASEEFKHRMREYQERVQQWSREGARGQMPPPPMFDGPGRREGDGDRGPGPRDGEGRRSGPPDKSSGDVRRSEHREIRETANITRSDDSGIYSLRRDGEKTVFSVKPKEGEEQSWPVNSDEERAAVPEAYRSKLREMDELRSQIRRDDGPPRGGSPERSRSADGPRDSRETPPPGRRPDGI